MALERFQSLIESSAARYGVPAPWISAVIMTESSGNPMAYRAEPQIGDASYGLMQLLMSTARGLGYTGDANGLYDAATNIDLGTRLLSDLRRRYGTDFDRIYSAYNSGSPSKYLTSSQVAANVARARDWLQQVISDNPAEASGALVIVVVVLLWMYLQSR